MLLKISKLLTNCSGTLFLKNALQLEWDPSKMLYYDALHRCFFKTIKGLHKNALVRQTGSIKNIFLNKEPVTTSPVITFT